jgi:hypothetical protein
VRFFHYLLLPVLLGGCKALTIDSSIAAAEAGDLTAIFSGGCSAQPVQGFDLCRVVEGAAIQEEIRVVTPRPTQVVSGEVVIRYKGTVRSYAFKSDGVLVVPWKELIQHETYERNDAGPAQIEGTARVKGPDGEHFVQVLGRISLLVLAKGYAPMPLDSGNQAWGATCRIQYSTSGRSSLACR